MRPDNDRIFDVAILGTGFGGTLLGTILGANNRRVLLIEQGIHPRFAIGESTIPETTLLLRLLSKRYGVPEIANLSPVPGWGNQGAPNGVALTSFDSLLSPLESVAVTT